MKKVARKVVSTKYINPLSSDFEGGNQLEVYEIIKNGVTGLLNKGHFLRGGFDENISLFFLKSLFKSPIIFLGPNQEPWSCSYRGISPPVLLHWHLLISFQKILSTQFLTMPMHCY